MKLPHPFKEKADFEHFREMATGKGKGGPVPLVELFADPEIMSEVTGIEFPAEKYLELMNLSSQSSIEMLKLGLDFLDLHLAFSKAVGYDYVTAFPTIPLARTPSQMVPNPAQQGKVRIWQNEHQGVITSREAFRDFPWPGPEDWSIVSVLVLESRLPPGARINHFAFGIFEEVRNLMGLETLAIKSIEDPELVDDVLEKLTGLLAVLLEKAAAHPAVGAIFYGDDLAFNSGPMISPRWLREHVFPRQKRLAEIAHRHGKPFLFHCCGRSESFMEDLIETVGIDAYHSFQDNVIPVEEYYRRYHDRIGILGGLDVGLLATGTPDQVRARCRQILDVCGLGGGYCMGSGNSVTNYCSVQNYYAMIDETRKWNQEHF